MNTTTPTTGRARWMVRRALSLLCLAGTLPLAAQEAAAPKETPAATPEEESPEEYRNWVTLSLGGTFVDGNDAAFQQRLGLPARRAFGGVQDFHYEQDVGKRGLFMIDGRGIFDEHDYSIRLDLSQPDMGYVRAGYQQFRTYYDGSGGYFPGGTNNWFSIFDDALHVDRGEVWFEAGLRLPDVPELTFRYSHQFRDGQKDSTVWGDSNLTGGVGGRGFVASFWDLDEVRDIFSGDARHTFGKTEGGVGIRYEMFDNNNSRNMRRRPFEPQDRHLTQRDGLEGDTYHVHAFTDTRFNERWQMTLGYAFTGLNTDFSGSRIYGSSYDAVYDPTFARRQFRDEGFLDLTGGSLTKQHVGNVNLMWTPSSKVAIIGAIRMENQEIESFSEFLETNVGSTPGLVSTQEELAAESDRGLLDVSESIEVRYTGFTNWVLYARGYWMQGQGDLQETETVVASNIVDLLRDTDFDRSAQKYTVGANWYPCRFANFAAQYYHKIRNEDYDHTQDSTPNRTGNRYPAFLTQHDFETDDVNFRVTLRPRNNVTLVGRYDFQLSTVEMQGEGLEKIESADITTHIFSANLSWTPFSRWYLQVGGSYVIDETDTPAQGALGATNLVLNSENNYWNVNFTTGYVLSEKTDLQAQYFYYRADNYVDNSLYSMPYGVGAEEHGVTAGITHRLTRRIQLALKYGFFNNRDETSGGNNDYDAHLVFTSVQYQF